MSQIDVLLAVNVFEFGVPQTDLRALFVELVFTALEVEAIRGERRFAEHRHVAHAAVVARAVGAELAAVEGQAVDLLRGDLATTEGLRQRTTVVRTQDRQHWHPFADLDFGLRQLGLERDVSAAEVVRRTPVVIQRQQLRAAGAFTAIEFYRIQAEHVHAETDGALGETGFGVEDEVLRPFFSLALRLGRVGEVAVDVEVAQVQVGAGALDKPASSAAAGRAAPVRARAIRPGSAYGAVG